MNPLLARVQDAEDRLNKRWGYGQAITLVGDDLAAKVRRQISKWYAALAANDAAQIETHGNAMLKAFAAVDAAAVARHGEPPEAADEAPGVAVVRLRSDAVIHIVADGIEADRLSRQGHIAFTFDELALCAEAAPGWPVLMETKRLFGSRGNATVVRPNADRKFFDRGGDDIPF